MHSYEHYNKNYKLIGQGSSRHVYELNDSTVTKIPFNYGGYWQNINEINLYKKYKNTVLPLCPIDLSLSSKELIVMQRATPLVELTGKSKDLHLDFDSVIYDYVESCNTEIRTRTDKNKFIDSLISKNCDVRVVDFIKKLSMFKSSIIENIFYDVCSYNAGLINDQIAVLDYGFPDDGSEVAVPSVNFYVNTPEFNEFLLVKDKKSA